MTQINNTTKTIFESIIHLDDEKQTYWLARDLMPILGYDAWRNFNKVITKAKQSLNGNYPQTHEHFVEVDKKVKIGTGTSKEATRTIKDYKLTRYACYLIAQNGDSKKEAIALAQNYFTQQTRKQELQEDKQKNVERILARRRLTETEKKFGDVLAQRDIKGREIAEIKSAGDHALFGNSTKEVKKKLGVKQYKPLADHLPTISIKAKDLATEMTTHNTKIKDLQGKTSIKTEHIDNNSAVRKMLTESGIYPESLPAEEDVKRLEKKIDEEDVKDIEETKLLSMEMLEIDIRNVIDEDKIKEIKTIITDNHGSSPIKIYYGSYDDTKVIERTIQINSVVVTALKPYIVIPTQS